VHAHPESVCNPIIELLSREGFSIYHRTTTDEVTDIQLVRGAPVLLGEVEAVRILVQRREDGYHLSVQVAVYGKDIVRTLPNRIEILENAICDVVRATDMSRHTVGIIGLGALNAYQLQRRLFRCIDDLLRAAARSMDRSRQPN